MRNSLRAGCLTLAIALACLVALESPLVAQDNTVAEQLFREGKRLMGEGKFAEACKAFAGSYRKDAALSTLLNLADCREKNEQYASAWATFLDVERLARGEEGVAAFVKTAKERAAKLEPKLSYLIINVTVQAKVEGLEISRNGVRIEEAEWNTPIPVDGGEYKVEGRADGFDTWETTVTVDKERERESVDVPKLRASPEPQVQTGREGQVTDPVVPATNDERPVADDASTDRRTVAKVSVASGGVLILTGLAFGYLAQQKWADAESLCGADHMCDSIAAHAAGNALVESARLRGNIATVSTTLGIAAVGVGAFLWLRGGRGRGASRGPDEASLNVTPIVTSDGVVLVIGSSL